MSMLSIFFFIAVLGLAFWTIVSTLLANADHVFAAMAGPRSAPAHDHNVVAFPHWKTRPVKIDRIAA